MNALPLQLNFENLPLTRSIPPDAVKQRVIQKYEEWICSEFAGFRRNLNESAKEYPNFSLIKKTAEQFQTGATGKRIRNFILLGTGGSSLGGEAILRALRSSLASPQFFFLDNNDPDFFNGHLHHLNPEETLFYAVSKSGKTPETISQMLVGIEWLKKHFPNSEDWKKHIVLCTDPEKGDFREFAKQFQLACLDVPSAVGGRFSVLTPVGLFPAVYAGFKQEAFLAGARTLVDAWEKLPLDKNPCFQLAWALTSDHNRPITVSMPYSSQLQPFSRWFCQLWAESLGKNGKGFTPYPAIGTTDQHSQMQLYMEGPRDKSIGFIEVKNVADPLMIPVPSGTENLPAFQELQNKSMADLFRAEFHATRDAITKQGIPNFTISIETLNENSLGALFYFWEWTTLYAGALMEINPFDQPGVEAAKILTKQYLAKEK